MKSAYFSVLVLLAALSRPAQAEPAAAHTCHVQYYCSSASGADLGPYETTAGVEERQCATNSSRVIDSLRGACAVRGTLRVTYAIFGPQPAPEPKRCNVAFRCPGNSQTIRMNLQISAFACKNGYVGNWRGHRQDINYYKYHNEFSRSLGGLCPGTNQNPAKYSRSLDPSSIESVTWRLPVVADNQPNPALNCRCFTRCYGPRTGWTGNIEYQFQTPFAEYACIRANTRERAQAACNTAGTDTWPQGSTNPETCLEAFATGQLNPPAGQSATPSSSSATSH